MRLHRAGKLSSCILNPEFGWLAQTLFFNVCDLPQAGLG